MGLFLNTAIAQNCTESDVNLALQRLAQNDPSLAPAACQYKQCDQGVQVLLPERRTDYDKLANILSKELSGPVLLLYIHDERYWGYCFYDSGQELDCFHSIPEDEELSPEERQRLAGNSGVIAQRFHIDQGTIRHYLAEQIKERSDSAQPSTAYPDDQFCVGSPWQMMDFMKKLGFPYPWDNSAPSKAAPDSQAAVEPPLEQPAAPPLETAPDAPPSEPVPASPPPPETAPPSRSSPPSNAGSSGGLSGLMATIVAAIAAGAGGAYWSFAAYTSQQFEVLPIPVGIVLAAIALNVILWKKYIRARKQRKSNLAETLK